MAETSGWWTTDGTGDGKIGGYTQADHSIFFAIIAACCGKEGVAPGYANELVPAANGANTVRVGTGGALVDGKPYDNSAAVDVNIPSASGAGNTRIDRVVLRADWAAQTVRITRIAGVDAASPSAPAPETTSGTLYDILICQVLVNTAGAVTVTDERVMADVPTIGIENNAVTNPKLRDSSALSVIGRAANSVGDPADIVASANDRILARVSNALGFGQLTAGMFPAGVVATAAIANDAVDDTKVGNRVPQFYRRQGGAGPNWNTPGTTAHTPGAVRMQAGVAAVTIQSDFPFNAANIIFPVAFSAVPLVFCQIVNVPGGSPDTAYTVQVDTPSATTADCVVFRSITTSTAVTVHLAWLAIGPE